jgi:hypothetical protein
MARQQSGRKWSAKVTETSDALDLKENIFKSRSAKPIAASLKQSAEHSHRRKASPFQWAMSMLNFYINRAGTNLSASRKRVLEAAKTELRRLFDRPAPEQPSPRQK